MPIPIISVAAAPLLRRPVPPTPVIWENTRVTLFGQNGEGDPIPLTELNDPAWPGLIMQPGATGLDMPPYSLFSDESPNLDGSIYRGARAQAREIMIPVYLHGIDRGTINNLKRMLFQALNPRRGYCRIQFTESRSRTRYIDAYYKGGMEGSESTDAAGFRWAKFALTFTAMDPWFYPDRAQSTKWSFGAGASFLHSSRSFIPIKLASGVMGVPEDDYQISNPGDVEAWPIWKLSGPIKSFALRGPNGDLVKASPPEDGSDLVPTGRTLTIDTRPGKKTVKDNAGVNYWTKLDLNPQFWSVEPGDSTVSISVVAGTASASVALSFNPRYASFV